MSRRRTALVVVGAIVMAFGGLAAVTGLVLAVVFGPGNMLASGPHPVTTATRALVSPMAELDGVSEAPSVLGRATIQVDATVRAGERGVFVGVATADDVQRYLAGADVDVVTDVQFQPFRLTTRHQPGTVAVPAPRTQGFWVARAEADAGTVRLSWPVRDGDYRVVVMNSDRSPDVHVDARFAIVVPSALRVSLIVLVAGLATALLGAIVLAVGLLSPSTAPRPPSGGGQPPRAPSTGSRPPAAGAPGVVPVPAQGARTTPTTGSEAR